MLKKTTVQNGDVFVFQLSENQFIFFRVLLSISDLYNKKLIDETSGLFYFKDLELIEVYQNLATDINIDMGELKSTISDPFFCFISPLINMGKIKPIGNKPPLDSEILFPEFVTTRSPDTALFIKGEIQIEFSYNISNVEELDVILKTFPGMSLGQYYISNHPDTKNLNLKNENLDWCQKRRYSLSYNPKKKEIYNLIGIKNTDDYELLSISNGFEFSRLLSQ